MAFYQLLEDEPYFPNPEEAEPDGLIAIGGDLSVERLINAYAAGIFPWFNEGDPLLWWSPNPRFVLFLDKLKISKSLKQTLRKQIFNIKYDTCFAKVLENCSSVKRKDEEGTWITEEMKKAYLELHELGLAHSIEVFFNDELVGGLYGVALGGVFCGESMFHTVSNASKVAFVSLVEKLKELNFDFIDAQMHTEHLEKFGAKNIPRTNFLSLLKKALEKSILQEKWTVLEEKL